jgi:SAM-dependent methyltransferase
MKSNDQPKLLLGQTGGQHPLAKLIDHQESYGPHVIERFIGRLANPKIIADIGAGSGRDIAIAKRIHPAATTVAIEGGREYSKSLEGKVDHVHVLDIEKNRMPFENETVDLFIANQVLEHTKEIFWIFHEVTRTLRVGGHFIIGVPNVASLHNRLLLLMGGHPTQHKLCLAHVRPFSKKDTCKFLEACFPYGFRLVDFAGSQFYPFPRILARLLSKWAPTYAFSIFFLLEKTKSYNNEFAMYPARAKLETNFWSGNINAGSQY